MSTVYDLPAWARDNQAYLVNFSNLDSEKGVSTEKPIKANVGGSANTISSRHVQYSNVHTPILDLDIGHMLIPSTTPGHAHLYLNVSINSEVYNRLLVALRDAGIIQQGILDQWKEHGATFARLPDVKKSANDSSS